MELSKHPRCVPFILLLALTALVSTGCTARFQERRLVAPDDPRAQLCVTDCDLGETQCRARQTTREQDCRTYFELPPAEVEACRATPGALCLLSQTCPSADMTICELEHEHCVVGCGGRIDTRWSFPSLPAG